MNSTPALHLSNVFGSPATSLLGAAMVLQNAGNTLATGVPNNTAGWLQFAMSMLVGLVGMLTRG